MTDVSKRTAPLIFAFLLTLADQVTKYLVASLIPLNSSTPAWQWGDFFWLVHQRNPGVAFSFGFDWPGWVRTLGFVLVPVVVLGLLTFFYWKDKTLTTFQRWSFGLILGGGVGNVIDRVFRPEGVVDFLSFKFYGLFGFERWPTFNLADSCVVVGVACVVLSFFIRGKAK